MKKYTKVVTLLLIAGIVMTSVASCAIKEEKNKKKKHRDKKDETEAVEKTEVAAETTPVIVPETEAVAETEAMIPEGKFMEGSYADVYALNSQLEEDMYDAFMAKGLELYAENPDLLYAFDGSDKWASMYVGVPNSDVCVSFSYYNGEVVQDDELLYWPKTFFTFDEFVKFPVMLDSLYGATTVVDELDYAIEDGVYYGRLLAVNIEGTQAILVAGKTIELTAEEFEDLKPGDHISIADNDPRFCYDLTVSNSYTDSYNIFDDDCYFLETIDGTYILCEPSDCAVTYDNQIVLVDIAPDCEISDMYYWLYSVDKDQLGFMDGPNTFTRSFFFYYMVNEEYSICYNGWFVCHSILEPVTIKDNTIVNIYLSWR